MKKIAVFLTILAAIGSSLPAQARDTQLMMPLASAMADNDAQARLGDDVKFYFGKQKTPRVRDGYADVVVRDNGMGIDAAMLARIFNSYTQAQRNPERGVGGLGLGLSLVKKLVELHGGTVSASSDGAGQGSAFTVTLPVQA